MRPRTATHPTDAAGRRKATTDPSGSDLVREDIEEAVHDLGDGRRTRARRRLVPLWAQVPVGSAHRSALAHWLAEAEQSTAARLVWDERAVEAADAADDWSAPFAGTALTVGAMYPELHLELARDYRRLGSSCAALEHLALARNAVDAAARGRRRTLLRRQLTALDREISGMRDRYPDEDELDRWTENAEELADFWDGPASDDEGLV